MECIGNGQTERKASWERVENEFADQQYARLFDNEQRTKTMAGLFAGLAIALVTVSFQAMRWVGRGKPG